MEALSDKIKAFLGDGSGDGSGDGGVAAVNGRTVYLVDDVPTIFTAVTGDVAKGFIHKVIDPEREKKGFEAAEFFYKFLQVSLLGTKVCVENPLPLKHFWLPRYSQIIHPYYFGEPWSKRTCLWLVGLPLLIPTNILKSHEPWVNTRGHSGHSGRNPKIRAKTFRGIAKAMAEQWG